MCLTCKHGRMTKEEKEQMFKYTKHKACIRTFNNKDASDYIAYFGLDALKELFINKGLI